MDELQYREIADIRDKLVTLYAGEDREMFK